MSTCKVYAVQLYAPSRLSRLVCPAVCAHTQLPYWTRHARFRATRGRAQGPVCVRRTAHARCIAVIAAVPFPRPASAGNTPLGNCRSQSASITNPAPALSSAFPSTRPCTTRSLSRIQHSMHTARTCVVRGFVRRFSRAHALSTPPWQRTPQIFRTVRGQRSPRMSTAAVEAAGRRCSARSSPLD